MSTPSACPAPPGLQIGRAHADQHRGCGTADGRVFARAGGGVDDRREHVVPLLVGGALLTRLGQVRRLFVGHERCSGIMQDSGAA